MHGGGRFDFLELLLGLAAGAVYCFYYCFVSWRRNRVIGDTPTSRVRSAAQGYVELAGHGQLSPGSKNKAPLSDIPCVWWRYKVEHKGSLFARSRSWHTVMAATSTAPFLLDDGTGQCEVDPEGAQVYPHGSDVWYGHEEWPSRRLPGTQGPLHWLWGPLLGGPYRYSEQRLEAEGRVVAVGLFRSRDATHGSEAETALAALLHMWKCDQRTLLQRFDTDGDGVLSADEWDGARAAAREQVTADLAAKPQVAVLSRLVKPADGRPFLISGSDPTELVRGLRHRAAAGLAGFVAGCLSVAWMLMHL
jgi:E3 ubiquitin ligase